MAKIPQAPPDDGLTPEPAPEPARRAGPPPCIRCVTPLFVRSCPWRAGHSLQVRFRDVFTGEQAAWLWERHDREFEPYEPPRR